VDASSFSRAPSAMSIAALAMSSWSALCISGWGTRPVPEGLTQVLGTGDRSRVVPRSKQLGKQPDEAMSSRASS
jgi:hypothetical protein